MKSSRLSLLAFTALALAVTAVVGCASSQASTPRTTGGASANVDSSAHTATSAPKRQLGIDMDFYTYTGYNVAPAAAADIAYAKHLGANAVSVSFPFFVSSPTARTVHGTSSTPSPAQLAILAQDAKKDGMYFSIRPLLDETVLHKVGGRVHWKPVSLASFFSSYESFLKPYAQMAQKYHINEIVIGVEFDAFNKSSYWGKLASYLRRYYKGTLAYSNNWDFTYTKRVNSSGVVQLLDAYPIMKLPDNTSVRTLTAHWDAYLHAYPRSTVISELGIAAQSGAYHVPYRIAPNGQALKPYIQQRWFTAACDAVANEHDGGIYFWVLNVGQPVNVPPNRTNPSGWVDGPGAKTITACFKHLR